MRFPWTHRGNLSISSPCLHLNFGEWNAASRAGGSFCSQIVESGHAGRFVDLNAVARLVSKHCTNRCCGKLFRAAILLFAADAGRQASWRTARARHLLIAGPVHHGGSRHTNLCDPALPELRCAIRRERALSMGRIIHAAERTASHRALCCS